MNNDFSVNTWDVLDYAANGGAGIGDGITFGFLDDARKYLGINDGISKTSAVYTAGLYTGTAIGMGVSGGAGGGAAATSWAVRTGRVYVSAAKAIDIATTAKNVANGNISMYDMVSLLPGGGKTGQTLKLKNNKLDALVETAKKQYPKKAGKIEQHQ